MSCLYKIVSKYLGTCIRYFPLADAICISTLPSMIFTFGHLKILDPSNCNALQGHTSDAVYVCAISPNSDCLASAGNDGHLRLWSCIGSLSQSRGELDDEDWPSI